MQLRTWHGLIAVALLTPLACSGGTAEKKQPTLSGGDVIGGGDDGMDKPDDPDNGGGGDVDKPDDPDKSMVDPVAVFAEDCRKGLNRAKAQLPALLAVEGERTEANLLVPYNKMANDFLESAGTAELFSQVHPDKAIRDEANTCSEEVSKFGSELSRNQALFAAFSKIDQKKLDANAKRLVEHTLRDFRRAGVDKDEKTRARLKEIDARLTTLGNDFSKNVNADVKSIKVKPEELDGLPPDWIKAHEADDKGMLTVTTNYPDYIPFISYAKSTERRKELYIKFKSRGGEANEKVLREVLTLRAEKAKLLGYKNWADYVTEDKMVGSARNADRFIKKVIASARKQAKKDYKELLAYKKKLLDKKARRVEDYEKTFIENKLKADKYSFDAQAVRAYFPYKRVEAGLLEITSQVFGVEYKKAKDAQVWHQDVRSYDVYRKADNKKLGRIYLDMHPRDGKYKHAAQFPYRNGVAGLRLPEGVLVCNFPNPRTDGDALMEHAQVETMFHEFGHLMHHVLGGHQKWVDQSGVATEWDFVEAPSQMFEEWANNHATLALFAKHNESGEVIPKEMVDKMRTASTFGLGTTTLQQMFYASVSLGFHTANPKKLDMNRTVKKLQTKITPFRFVEGTQFHTNFGHLMGYSAIYYTYMWSKVIAQDLLTPFKKQGLMNPELTAKYRDKILVPGGTKDAADLVADFLGREFNYKAFENYLAGK